VVVLISVQTSAVRRRRTAFRRGLDVCVCRTRTEGITTTLFSYGRNFYSSGATRINACSPHRYFQIRRKFCYHFLSRLDKALSRPSVSLDGHMGVTQKRARLPSTMRCRFWSAYANSGALHFVDFNWRAQWNCQFGRVNQGRIRQRALEFLGSLWDVMSVGRWDFGRASLPYLCGAEKILIKNDLGEILTID
jgi:hypothetical protein